MKRVFYHHPITEDYSLRFVGESTGQLLGYASGKDHAEVKHIGYPFEPPVFATYVREVESRDVSELEYDEEWLQTETASLSSLGKIVVFRLIELLEAAIEGQDSDEFNLYKRLQPAAIDEALAKVEWGEMLPTVAGELMSNLILRHALPNANHRTAIAMLQFCIEAVDATFEMPRTHIDDENWQEWANGYIADSKRLLTVRRNHLRFHHLERLGVDAVLRKGGIEIRLHDYDLDLSPSEAKTRYAKEHEMLCREFATAVLGESSNAELANSVGPTRAEFEKYLRIGVLEHDFDDLFT